MSGSRTPQAVTPLVRFARAARATVYGWLGSPVFFWVLLGVFILQALWIALSARYPQAFDENFHFGLIQLHAQQWLPFFTQHPAGAEIHGAVTRDPSYFYHYLFSLPYRLLAAITDSTAIQVIILRLCNIGLFVWGLFVYRRLFGEMGISRRMTNAVFLFFVLTPIVPLLAAQINYDNLIFVLTALLFLYSLRYFKKLQASGRIDFGLLMQIAFVGLLAAIVKYTSLPLFIPITAIIAALTVVHLRRTSPAKKIVVWPRKTVLIIYAVLLSAVGVLAVERFGINMVRYQSPSPDCAKVLSVEQCMSYSPWARDHIFSQTYPEPSGTGIAVYPVVWAHRMVFETMFTISSWFRPDGTVDYHPAPPLTVANYTAWTIVVAGGILTAVFWRRLWGMTYLRYFLLAISFYTVVLFLKNLAMYLHSGEAVAIHGRYLVPMYPVLYLTLALVFGWFFDRIRLPKLKVWLLVVTFILFLHGAGLIVWVFRSDPRWYWSSEPNSLVFMVNDSLQNIVHRVIMP